jgi:anti-sigma B factor antagonist
VGEFETFFSENAVISVAKIEKAHPLSHSSATTKFSSSISHDIILEISTVLSTWRSSMDITVQEFKHCDMIAIKGRVDSSTAPQLAQALEAANDGGKYKLVVNMSELEYMSSAGFRALLAAQRNSKRYNRGEVVLASVPERIREALELAGFTELFKTFDDPLQAVGHF